MQLIKKSPFIKSILEPLEVLLGVKNSRTFFWFHSMKTLNQTTCAKFQNFSTTFRKIRGHPSLNSRVQLDSLGEKFLKIIDFQLFQYQWHQEVWRYVYFRKI